MTTVNFYVDAFVWRQGVSQILHPITIVEGLLVDLNKHFHGSFGEFFHTYKGTNNEMKLRTVGALDLDRRYGRHEMPLCILPGWISEQTHKYRDELSCQLFY